MAPADRETTAFPTVGALSTLWCSVVKLYATPVRDSARRSAARRYGIRKREHRTPNRVTADRPVIPVPVHVWSAAIRDSRRRPLHGAACAGAVQAHSRPPATMPAPPGTLTRGRPRWRLGPNAGGALRARGVGGRGAQGRDGRRAPPRRRGTRRHRTPGRPEDRTARPRDCAAPHGTPHCPTP